MRYVSTARTYGKANDSATSMEWDAGGKHSRAAKESRCVGRLVANENGSQDRRGCVAFIPCSCTRRFSKVLLANQQPPLWKPPTEHRTLGQPRFGSHHSRCGHGQAISTGGCPVGGLRGHHFTHPTTDEAARLLGIPFLFLLLVFDVSAIMMRVGRGLGCWRLHRGCRRMSPWKGERCVFQVQVRGTYRAVVRSQVYRDFAPSYRPLQLDKSPGHRWATSFTYLKHVVLVLQVVPVGSTVGP